MTRTEHPDWWTQLTELIVTGEGADGTDAGGAQLCVTDVAGAVTYRQPLARHARLSDDLVWLRPIVGDGPDFDLNECRRRGLPANGRPVDNQITFDLGDGVVATVEPAEPDQLPALVAWDQFVMTDLDAEDEAALEELREDSWS